MSESRSLSEEYIIIDPHINEFTHNEWFAILKKNNINRTCPDRLRKSLIFGIPNSLRGDIWLFLSRSTSSAAYFPLSQIIDPAIEFLIQKDLPRTYPNHELFKEKQGPGQQAILNILRAYAQYDKEVGYCQGMPFIIGLLWMQIKSEELVFWAFVKIMQDLEWRGIFLNDTPKLTELLDTFEDLLEIKLNDVYMHFKREGLEINCFARCYITLFTTKSPLELSARIMDVFLLEGEKVIHSILLKMLELKQNKILQMQFEDLFVYFTDGLVRECYAEYDVVELLSLLGARREEEVRSEEECEYDIL